jgi:hypothetical protein
MGLEALTGLGLSTSAGLNAYIPLLCLGLLARFTDLVTLPDGWTWLQNPWVLVILALLLVIEVTADKVPAVDHVNDVVQTVVRPSAGGIVLGASAGPTTTVTDPQSFLSSGAWVPVLVGALIALVVHLVKAAARGVVNVTTMGFGAPVVSTVEDAFAVAMSLTAVLVPILVPLFLAALVTGIVMVLRRLSARRRTRAAARATT